MKTAHFREFLSIERVNTSVARSQVQHAGVAWALLAFLSLLPMICTAIDQGAFDPNFGNGAGYVEIDHPGTFGPEQDFGYALHIQRNGRPLVAGPNWVNSAMTSFTLIARLTASGAYDSTFGFGGSGRSFLSSDILGGSYYETTFAMRLDTNQRPVFAGANIGDSHYRAFVARCADAACTSSVFAPGVAIAFPPEYGNVYTYALAIDSVGRIVVAGRAEFLSGGCAAWVAQLLPDFSAAPQFVTKLSFTGLCAEFLAVTLQSDDKIVVVGKLAGTSDAGRLLAVRYTTTGSIDPLFNGGQPKLLDFRAGAREDSATAVALDSQNRIVIGGYSQYSGADFDFAAARLQFDGNLDVSFGFGGVALIPFDIAGSDLQDLAYGVAVDYGDKVVLGGRVRVDDPFSNFDIGAVRLNADGRPDLTFGTNGRTHGGMRGSDDTGFTFGADERVTAMARDRSGRIYLSGTTDANRYWTPGQGENQFIVRLTGDGIFADGIGD
jgi:uncharacterized delta-60 repeat protein